MEKEVSTYLETLGVNLLLGQSQIDKQNFKAVLDGTTKDANGQRITIEMMHEAYVVRST